MEEIPLLGFNAPAVISNQGASKNGLVIVLFSFPDGMYFNTTCVKDVSDKTSLTAGEELGEELLYGCKGIRRNLSIVFSDGNIPNAQDIAFGLQKRVGKSFPMVGAFTYSQNPKTEKTSLYFGNSALSNATCGILFGGKFEFGLSMKHGWHPLGKPRRITLSEGNMINEIEGKPAASLYQEYFDKDSFGLRKDLKCISKFYPLGINIPGEEEYILRSLSSIRYDDSLVFNGDIPTESTVKLMVSSKESCLESARQAAESAKKSLENQQPKLILVFNSWARSTLLGRQENYEIEEIKKVFGQDAPIAGAYTYAEQAPLNSESYLGRPYYHNNSVTILAMAG